MNKYELVSKIELIAPLETQEAWDCSGWIVDDVNKSDINKVMLALTVTKEVINQAKNKNCDLIIAHHPLFFVPYEYKDIQIYSSHTPLDKAKNGTTETLLKQLGFDKYTVVNDFVRNVKCDLTVNELRSKLKKISDNVRLVNNKNINKIHDISFCAGSGSEFIKDSDADCFVTGDLKYHTVVEEDKVLFDIGHFESEILILKELEYILGIEVEFAHEKAPFV